MCLTRLWYDKNMEANEYTEFEGRRYVNPTISRDEQMAFIDNLRNTQTANNEQIQTDTYNLGTHIPMTQGGLATGATDPDSYFMKRYQTPQADSQVATLKATAQAQALNDVLSNYQKQMKKRYNDAYRAYNKRKNTPATTPANPANPANPTDPNENPLDKSTEAGTDGGKITTDPYTDRNTTSFMNGDGVWVTMDTDTGEILDTHGTDKPTYGNARNKGWTFFDELEGALKEFYGTAPSNGGGGTW